MQVALGQLEIPQEHVVVVTKDVRIRDGILHGGVGEDRRVHFGDGFLLLFNVNDALDGSK